MSAVFPDAGAVAINVSGLTKHYGRTLVLDDVSITVKQGEFVGLVGSNGAGKTTLIKCLLDFISADRGLVELFGVPGSQARARAPLAYLPEKFIPPYYLSGSDFLKYMSALYGMTVSHGRLTELLGVLDLDERDLAKPVRQLSKGMGQKLGLLCCLLSDRPLLVLDEPMSGLDPKVRALLKSYLVALKSSGKTLFFSTHLLTDVEYLCDRVAILHHGSIRFSGSPAQCCERFQAPDFDTAYLACIGQDLSVPGSSSSRRASNERDLR